MFNKLEEYLCNDIYYGAGWHELAGLVGGWRMVQCLYIG